LRTRPWAATVIGCRFLGGAGREHKEQKTEEGEGYTIEVDLEEMEEAVRLKVPKKDTPAVS